MTLDEAIQEHHAKYGTDGFRWNNKAWEEWDLILIQYPQIQSIENHKRSRNNPQIKGAIIK